MPVWDWSHPLDSFMGWVGYKPIQNVNALGNTVNTPNITAQAQQAALLNMDQLKPILDSNPLFQTVNPQQFMEYANANKLGLTQLQNVAGNQDAAKQLVGAIQNNQAMARPDAWSMEGAFGNKNYAGWAGTAIQGLSALGNLYLGYQGLKQSKKMMNEQIALQRANYRNTAKAMNNQYRDQMSGRGYNGMSQGSMRALGREYDNRRVAESY